MMAPVLRQDWQIERREVRAPFGSIHVLCTNASKSKVVFLGNMNSGHGKQRWGMFNSGHSVFPAKPESAIVGLPQFHRLSLGICILCGIIVSDISLRNPQASWRNAQTGLQFSSRQPLRPHFCSRRRHPHCADLNHPYCVPNFAFLDLLICISACFSSRLHLLRSHSPFSPLSHRHPLYIL
jgi:hypothetical protein